MWAGAGFVVDPSPGGLEAYRNRRSRCSGPLVTSQKGKVMPREIRIARMGGDYICVGIDTGKRSTRIFLTEDQAQHLSNRLQSFAKGGFGSEVAVKENEV